MTDPGIASYRLSKWAVNGLTMLQAKELEGVISVNAFDPGWVRTDLGGEQAPGTPEEAAEGMLKTLCLPFAVTGKFFKDGKEIPW
jgi:NAD(P)-dependent dehydrogenase (short-subunit alcohol dehydrogenase family)